MNGVNALLAESPAGELAVIWLALPWQRQPILSTMSWKRAKRAAPCHPIGCNEASQLMVTVVDHSASCSVTPFEDRRMAGSWGSRFAALAKVWTCQPGAAAQRLWCLLSPHCCTANAQVSQQLLLPDSMGLLEQACTLETCCPHSSPPLQSPLRPSVPSLRG